jgi:hypothetical protein
VTAQPECDDRFHLPRPAAGLRREAQSWAALGASRLQRSEQVPVSLGRSSQCARTSAWGRVRLAYIATFWFWHTLGPRCCRLSGRRAGAALCSLQYDELPAQVSEQSTPVEMIEQAEAQSGRALSVRPTRIVGKGQHIAGRG